MGFARFLFCISVFTISSLGFAEGFGQPLYNGNPQYGPPNPGYRGVPPNAGYRGGPPNQPGGYRGGPPNLNGGNGNYSNVPENYDPNIGGESQDQGNLQVNYEPPSAQVIEGSRIAAAHVMRHSMEMLTTCSMIRANQFRVRDSLLSEISASRGYITHVYNNLISGPNSPSDQATKGNNQYNDVGYSVCWWIDEMRLNATKVIAGIKLSQMIDRAQERSKYDQNQRAIFEYAKRLNISAQAAIASTYFYIATLHRTCISESKEDMSQDDLNARPYYCPGDVRQLKGDLVTLEAKAATLRNLLDNVRRFDNLKPGFPSADCIECTFRVYRYNPASTQRQNYVPYPFFPYVQNNGQQRERNPYLIYQSRRMISAPGIQPQRDDGSVARYDGMAWQQAWDAYDLRYLNASSPNSTRVGGPPSNGVTSPPPSPGVNGLPASNALRAPFDTTPSDASNPPPTTNGRPDTQAPPAQNPQLDAEPVPYGDLDPTQPRIQQ